ncbi:MAG: hypothetical protein O3B43_00035 [Chloroflexi bacterium]|nr:hypothetical protein [Chloroflexota bacterium]
MGADEERLLLWFAWGIVVLLVAEIVFSIQQRTSEFSGVARPLAAFFFALGLDFLRPDAYAIVPATIVALLVISVALRTIRRFWPKFAERRAQVQGILVMGSYALLLYAAIYKLFDRGWILPWSLLLAAGTFWLVLSQLWHWWDVLIAGNPKVSRFAESSFHGANVLIVVSAYFHYQQFY